MDSLTLHPAQHPAYPVTVYGKPDEDCFSCKKTKLAFDRKGIQYRYVDLTDPANADDLAALKALGVSQAPYIITPTREWGGLNPPRIIDTIAEYKAAVEQAA